MRKTFLPFLVLVLAGPALAQDECAAPDPVCAAREAVFAISAFDPLASAVRIAPDLLVTGRHVVADESEATIRLRDGGTIVAQVVPTGYPGDLVLLRLENLAPGPFLEIGTLEDDDQLFTIGADADLGQVRVYPPGELVSRPPAGKPDARIHSSAHSQPGNSGGALVDDSGGLVGLVASGGEGRSEAIPAGEIERLHTLSGPTYAEASARLGAAYRTCTEALEDSGPALSAEDAAALASECAATGNRQMLDLAGQTLGRAGHFDAAIALLKRSVEADPAAVNARLSLAVTYQLARRPDAALPHLRRLLELAPDDPQILRLAIQAGTAAGEESVVERAYDLLVEHHPEMAPAARRFIDDPPR